MELQISDCALNHIRFRAAMHPTWCMADFACPPNLPSPKRYVQAGKVFGRRGMRLPAVGRDFGVEIINQQKVEEETISWINLQVKN